MKIVALFLLAAIAGLPPIRPLFDHPVRDTTICLAPDGKLQKISVQSSRCGDTTSCIV